MRVFYVSLVTALITAVDSQACSSEYSCSSCASSSCGWCQQPATYEQSGTCASASAYPSSINSCPSSSSQAQYTLAGSCPDVDPCTDSFSCTSCSVQSSCVWIAPGAPSASSAVCVSSTNDGVRAPTTWTVYSNPASCSTGSAVAALSAGIITAIVLGVFFLIILPIAVGIAICMGVACCCCAASRPRRVQTATTVIMMPTSMPQVFVPISAQQQYDMQQQQYSLQQQNNYAGQHAQAHYASQQHAQQHAQLQAQQQAQQHAQQQYSPHAVHSPHQSLGSMGGSSPGPISHAASYAMLSPLPPQQISSPHSGQYPSASKTL